MRRALYWLLGVVLFVSVIGIAFVNYSMSFYNFGDQTIEKADAVIVLTGGEGRLKTALRIYQQSKARFLLISGVGKVTSVTSLFTREELENIDSEHIFLDRKSRSTHENALVSKEYIAEQVVTSVILVTSNYHMKRALYVFRQVFPDNVEIIPHVVISENFDLEQWWTHPKSLRLAFMEFLKYNWYRLTL